MSARITLALISYTVGVFILTRAWLLFTDRDFGKPHHVMLGISAVFTSMWTFSYSVMYFTTDSAAAFTAYRWGSFGWTIGFSTLTVFFDMLFCAIHGRTINRAANIAVAATGLLFLAGALSGKVVASSLEPAAWGWRETVEPGSAWVRAYGIFIAAAMCNIIIRSVTSWRVIKLNRHRRLMKMISIPFAALTIPAAAVNYISPVAGIPEVPPVGHLVLGCIMLFICFAVTKYRVLDVDPFFMTERLLFEVSDYVFLTDTNGIIRKTGNAVRDVLSLDSRSLQGMNITEISFDLDMNIINEASGLHAPLRTTINTPHNPEIPVKCSITAVTDINDDPLGYLFVMDDLSDFHALENTTAELKKANELLRTISVTDPLTGIYNRKKFYEETERELSRFRRTGSCFSLIMLDIDHFKEINDVHGHAAGDEVLKKVSSVTAGLIRKTDTFARWGGEEFIILCVETTEDNAVILAERIRKNLENTVDMAGGSRITASFGITMMRDNLPVEELIARADRALYHSKEKGRNMVTIFREDIL